MYLCVFLGALWYCIGLFYDAEKGKIMQTEYIFSVGPCRDLQLWDRRGRLWGWSIVSVLQASCCLCSCFCKHNQCWLLGCIMSSPNFILCFSSVPKKNIIRKESKALLLFFFFKCFFGCFLEHHVRHTLMDLFRYTRQVLVKLELDWCHLSKPFEKIKAWFRVGRSQFENTLLLTCQLSIISVLEGGNPKKKNCWKISNEANTSNKPFADMKIRDLLHLCQVANAPSVKIRAHKFALHSSQSLHVFSKYLQTCLKKQMYEFPSGALWQIIYRQLRSNLLSIIHVFCCFFWG